MSLMKAFFVGGLPLLLPWLLWCSAAVAKSEGSTALQPVRLVTKSWPGYTNPDHSGGYFALVRQVLPAGEFQLQISFSNFNRAVVLVQKQQAEMVLAVSAADAGALLLSAAPIDADTVMAVFRTGMALPLVPSSAAVSPLEQYHLAWDLAYNYGKALGLTAPGFEVTDFQQGLELVAKGRVDIYLAEASELALPANQQLLQQLALQVAQIGQIPVYVGFTASPSGQQLKQQWDQHFALLRQRGLLRHLYQQYPGMVLLDCAEQNC